MSTKHIQGVIGLTLSLVITGCTHVKHKDNHNHQHHHVEEQTNSIIHNHEISIPIEVARQAGIVTSILKVKPFQQVLHTSGRIEAAKTDEITIVARVSGIIKFNKVIVEGSFANKGENLISISSQRLVDADPAERVRIAYETAKTEYERAIPLAKEKIVSAKELNRIKEVFEQARLAYEAIADETGYEGVKITLPASGYISEISVNEGDYVTVGQPLLKINQNKRLYLKAEVSERHYRTLEKVYGANFKISSSQEIYATNELNGRVLSYGRKVSDESHYLPIYIEFDNTDELLIGSCVEVYLLTETKPNVLTLPHTALTEEQGHFFAYIKVDESCYEKREIKLGEDNGREVEILAGLNVGEEVVTHGAYQVRLASVAKNIPGHSHEH